MNKNKVQHTRIEQLFIDLPEATAWAAMPGEAAGTGGNGDRVQRTNTGSLAAIWPALLDTPSEIQLTLPVEPCPEVELERLGWHDFLDAIHRSEQLNYQFDDRKKLVESDETTAEHHHVPTVESNVAAGGNGTAKNTARLDIPLQVGDQVIGALELESETDQGWDAETAGVIAAVASQVSQHLENLRLLRQAEQYRVEAEQASRRLIHQGWESYLGASEMHASGYGFVYDGLRVQPLDGSSTGGLATLTQELKVREATIGKLAVSQASAEPDVTSNLLSEVASRLSIHLENLRLLEETERSVVRLRELDHLKSAFLANMSHELRTPLNSILGFAQVILAGIDGPLTDTMANDLLVIEKNSKHLLSLINDVLDMAKIEAGRMDLNLEPVELSELLAEVLESSNIQAWNKSLYLRQELDIPDGLVLNGDRTRLRQVLVNLVGNAIKFTEVGGVTVRVGRDDQKVFIRVCDSGIGIPPDKLETIFEAFSQIDTSTTRKTSGTGLGLPISRRLVEAHGGRLWAESPGIPGLGSMFTLELPMDSPGAAPGRAVLFTD